MKNEKRGEFAGLLADYFKSFAQRHGRSAEYAPGSISSFDEQSDLDELERVLRDDDIVESIQEVPYGKDVLEWVNPGRDKSKPSPLKHVALLLEGVVEVQVPVQIPEKKRNWQDRPFQPSVVLSPPAIVGLFEAIPQSAIEVSQVSVIAGLQSFMVLLSMSQKEAWMRLAEEDRIGLSTTGLDACDDDNEKRTLFLKWPKEQSAGYPDFSKVIGPANGWKAKVAVLDVEKLFNVGYEALDQRQRRLRDLLYRAAIRQFGSSIAQHVPGYVARHVPRYGAPGAGEGQKVNPLDLIVSNLAAGRYPHHTVCATYDQAKHMLPIDMVCWNILDYMALVGGAMRIDKSKFGHPGSGLSEKMPDEDKLQEFFNAVLRCVTLVPAFGKSASPRVFSTRLWPFNTEIQDLVRTLKKAPRSAYSNRDEFKRELGLDKILVNTIPPLFLKTDEAQKAAPDNKDMAISKAVEKYLNSPLIYLEDAPQAEAAADRKAETVRAPENLRPRK